MGLITAVNGGVAGVDSFVGGYFAEHYGFRSIFWLMVVLAIVATALIAFLAGESKPAAGTAMDWLGVFFIVVAVGALLTALNEGAKLVGGFESGTLMLAIGLVAGCRCRVLRLLDCGKARQAADGGDRPPAPALHLVPLLTTTLTMTGIFAVINGIVPGLRPGGCARVRHRPHRNVADHPHPVRPARLAHRSHQRPARPVLGYTKVLRHRHAGQHCGLAIIAFFGLSSLPMMIAGTVLLGIMYAGTVNIMLNGLGVVLSPAGNPGFLPARTRAPSTLAPASSFLGCRQCWLPRPPWAMPRPPT